MDPNQDAEVDSAAIVHCLADHVLGDRELSATQIRAAEILLRRASRADDSAPEREPVTVRNVLVRPRRRNG